jgi:predicted nucleotide-binding protein
MGRLGRRRTFVLFEKRADLKLLSDLSGLILATYDGVWALKDVESAIAEACSPIRAAIKNQGKFDDDLPSAANWTILCDR